MKCKILFTCLSLAGLPAIPTIAQNCTVTVDALKGSYEGGCNNGKAEGKGKAIGEDSYEGEFKEGLPNGRGKYTWKNGNWYDGNWNKGVKEGRGTMVYVLSDARDSVIEGYWKKDRYTGKYEKPYVIYSKTIHITGISCRKLNNSRDQVNVLLGSETGNTNTSFSGGASPKPEITDITIISGTYIRKTIDNTLAKKIDYGFEDVTFPFRAIFTIGMDTFEIEIFEPGKWMVDVRMSD
jgi:hypothetical protein